ncbi:alpha/beta fold hydrolase [Halorientalis marina]|jgi:pimeloyl-ACP methyl ester carboxylesterase|uniref:alpha/beta fold hydrolase n=1 Tax=Halorientalis marina TaxID=2931976 RepID=UPI001FF5AA29|nr:alpha/beta hydrolase [Halorientalis marina]
MTGNSHSAVTETTIEANGLTFDAVRAGDGDPLVVLLHGFPDDAGSMAGLTAALGREGYTAVAPALRGYGTPENESIPDEEYHVAHVVRDVLEIVDELGFETATLVGHDTGAITAYFAAKFAPDVFTRIVTMAVPPLFWQHVADHPQQLFRSWYIAFFQLPGLPEAALRADDFALIERIWRDWSPGWEFPEDRLESVKSTFRTPGTVEAALSYYRHMFRPVSEIDAFRQDDRLSPTDAIEVPALVLGGETDGCVGPEMFRDIGRAFAGEWEREIVSDAGHFMHHERADRIESLVVDFLRRTEA